MAEENEIDLSTIIPDTFKGEDGAYDTAKFREEYDGLAAFKAQTDEFKAALPKEAGEYAFTLPEDHAWPEGFDPAAMTTKDEQGNEVQFDVGSLIDANDPDIPALQAILHEAGVPAGVMGKVASVVVNREIRNMLEGMNAAKEQKAALGPQADARIATVKHTLAAKMPAEQSKAILDSITSADALRGLEALLKGVKAPVSTAPEKKDLSNMSIDDRILLGLSQRKSA